MKFGIQRFLNPVDSPDSGFMKLSIRPRSKSGYGSDYKAIGHSVTFQLADCGERIFLEFGFGGIFNVKEFNTEAAESLASMRAKRKKMLGFVEAINKFSNKYLEALDKDEAALLEYIEKQKEHANKPKE